MDVLGEMARAWARGLLRLEPDLAAYIFRCGLALAAAFLLAARFVRDPNDDRELLRMRQVAVIATAAIVLFLVPVHWLDTADPRLRVAVLTACLLAMVTAPYFLPYFLAPTAVGQRLVRRVVYALVAVGFLLQLALSGGP